MKMAKKITGNMDLTSDSTRVASEQPIIVFTRLMGEWWETAGKHLDDTAPPDDYHDDPEDYDWDGSPEGTNFSQQDHKTILEALRAAAQQSGLPQDQRVQIEEGFDLHGSDNGWGRALMVLVSEPATMNAHTKEHK
jgi:hypothetical protein